MRLSNATYKGKNRLGQTDSLEMYHSFQSHINERIALDYSIH